MIRYSNINFSQKLRLFSSENVPTSKILVGELRKATGLSLSVCREAAKTNPTSSLESLISTARFIASQKGSNFEKLDADTGISSKNGLVGIFSNNQCFCSFKLICNSDFVSYNECFGEIMSNISKYCLLNSQVVSKYTFFPDEKIRTIVDEGACLLGEKLSLGEITIWPRRKEFFYSQYAHGMGPQKNTGRILAQIGYTCEEMNGLSSHIELADRIVQQVAGMNPQSIHELYEQEYLFSNGGKSVMDEVLLKCPGFKIHSIFRSSMV